MKTVRHLLQTKSNRLFKVTPDTSVHDAMKIMAEENVGTVLIMDKEMFIGILSERDITRKLFLMEKLPREVPVTDVMTSPVICVSPDQTNEECMAIMTDKRVRHLPVLEQGRIIGVVSIGDLVKATISEQEFIISQLETYITGGR